MSTNAGSSVVRNDNLGVLSHAKTPFTILSDALLLPITPARLVACLLCLAFIPFFRFSFTMQPSLGVSLLQGAPQVLLIALALLFAAWRIRLNWSAILGFGTIILIAVSQACGLAHSPAAQKNFVMPATFVLLLPTGLIVSLLFTKVDVGARATLIARIAKCLLAIMSFECALRLVFSPFINAEENLNTYGLAVVRDDWFYRYKQSLLFGDSNSVGIALLCLIGIMLAFREQFRRRHLLFAYLLLLATFSRASIIAAVLQFLFYKFWRWRRWILGAIVVSSPFILLRLLSWYIDVGDQASEQIDLSFVSKLFILQNMIDIYSRADIVQRLFGIGSGNTEYLAGIAAHNILVAFVLELGFVGSIAFLIYMWLLGRGSPRAAFLLVLPLFVNGFSLFLTTIPYFYLTLGVLGTLKTARTESERRSSLIHSSAPNEKGEL
jgi:hypothetical protein